MVLLFVVLFVCGVVTVCVWQITNNKIVCVWSCCLWSCLFVVW